MHLIVIAAVIM